VLGLERGALRKEDDELSFGGIRTFALITLARASAASSSWSSA
jgi:hypothetical protein